MRARAYVHNLIFGNAERFVGVLKDLPGRLVSLRLLGRDNAVDVTAKLRDIAGDDFLLIGNVPYYITTPIVFKALEPPMPRRSVFLVQREVAERMAAKAGDDDYGALSVNVAVVANVEQVLRVPAGAFATASCSVTRRKWLPYTPSIP